jgi:uncharacterized membrane protein
MQKQSTSKESMKFAFIKMLSDLGYRTKADMMRIPAMIIVLAICSFFIYILLSVVTPVFGAEEVFFADVLIVLTILMLIKKFLD